MENNVQSQNEDKINIQEEDNEEIQENIQENDINHIQNNCVTSDKDNEMNKIEGNDLTTNYYKDKTTYCTEPDLQEKIAYQGQSTTETNTESQPKIGVSQPSILMYQGRIPGCTCGQIGYAEAAAMGVIPAQCTCFPNESYTYKASAEGIEEPPSKVLARAEGEVTESFTNGNFSCTCPVNSFDNLSCTCREILAEFLSAQEKCTCFSKEKNEQIYEEDIQESENSKRLTMVNTDLRLRGCNLPICKISKQEEVEINGGNMVFTKSKNEDFFLRKKINKFPLTMINKNFSIGKVEKHWNNVNFPIKTTIINLKAPRALTWNELNQVEERADTVIDRYIKKEKSKEEILKEKMEQYDILCESFEIERKPKEEKIICDGGILEIEAEGKYGKLIPSKAGFLSINPYKETWESLLCIYPDKLLTIPAKKYIDSSSYNPSIANVFLNRNEDNIHFNKCSFPDFPQNLYPSPSSFQLSSSYFAFPAMKRPWNEDNRIRYEENILLRKRFVDDTEEYKTKLFPYVKRDFNMISIVERTGQGEIQGNILNNRYNRDNILFSSKAENLEIEGQEKPSFLTKTIEVTQYTYEDNANKQNKEVKVKYVVEDNRKELSNRYTSVEVPVSKVHFIGNVREFNGAILSEVRDAHGEIIVGEDGNPILSENQGTYNTEGEKVMIPVMYETKVNVNENEEEGKNMNVLPREKIVGTFEEDKEQEDDNDKLPRHRLIAKVKGYTRVRRRFRLREEKRRPKIEKKIEVKEEKQEQDNKNIVLTEQSIPKTSPKNTMKTSANKSKTTLKGNSKANIKANSKSTLKTTSKQDKKIDLKTTSKPNSKLNLKTTTKPDSKANLKTTTKSKAKAEKDVTSNKPKVESKKHEQAKKTLTVSKTKGKKTLNKEENMQKGFNDKKKKALK